MKKIIAIFAVLIGLTLAGCDNTTVLPELSFEQANISVEVGEELTLVPIITQTEEELEVAFQVEKPTIIAFDGTKFTAIAVGTSKITASLVAYPDVTFEITVTVTEATLEVYSITYHLDGGVLPSNAVTSFTTADLPITLPVPTKEGFTFLGWFTNAEKTGAAVTTIPSQSTNDQTFYAKWEEIIPEPEEYSITYHLNDGTLPSGAPMVFTSDDLPLTLPIPTKDGFTFLGWYLFDDFSGIAITEISSGIEDDQEFYAKWEEDIPEPEEYTITYHVDGGVLPNGAPVLFTEDDLPLTLPIPTKEGYNFMGWYLSASFDGSAVTAIAEDTEEDQEFYAKWERIIDYTNVYVNPIVSEKEIGETLSYGGRDYIVGSNAFATITEAMNVATARIYIAAGTYQENFTINKNNISLIGPNNGVDPRNSSRNQEAILKGTISLSNGVDNIKIVGLAFTESAKISARFTVTNFEFAFNNVYNTAVATSTWTVTPLEVNAFMSIYNTNSLASAASKNLYITNNRFHNVPEYNVSIARAENVVIQDNSFRNFTRDAVRFDGGFNGGLYLITKNEFINDTPTGYNGVYFRIYGADSAGVLSSHRIEITHNVFKNMGQNVLYSGAISARNYQEFGAEFEIMYNHFENTLNYIFLRNNATAVNHSNHLWIANINHNAFIGLPDTYYSRTKHETDTETTNPSLINFDHNYFEDNAGQTITDLVPLSSLFMDAASYADPYQSREEYDIFLSELETGSISMFVNEQWESKAQGESFDYQGRALVMGDNAFSTIRDAVQVSIDGERIFVLPGTYSQDFTINKNNITIIANNMNVNPNRETRTQEAIITGKVTLASGIENLVLNGLAFTDRGQIVSTGGIFDASFMYLNFYESTVPAGDDALIFLKSTGATDIQTHFRLMFLNNQFHSSVNSRLVYMDIVEDLVARGNHFETAGTTYADGLRVFRLRSTVPVVIESNTFKNIFQYSIFISNHAVTQMDIINNTFTDLGDYDGAISIRAYYGTATTQNRVIFNILHNTFEDVVQKAMRIDHQGTVETSVFEINVHFNIYKDGKPTFYFHNNLDGVAANMDQNYFAEGTSPQASKFKGVASNINHYSNLVDVPRYETSDEILPTRVNILNPIETMYQFDEYQIEFSVGPELATNKKVVFLSSNQNIATVNSMGLISAKATGTVMITIQSEADPGVDSVMFIEVVSEPYLSVIYDSNATLKIGEEDALSISIHNLETTDAIQFVSSNPSIATVDATGRVVGVAEGSVIITATLNNTDLQLDVGFTVYDESSISEIMQMLIDYNVGQLFTQDIAYIGFQGVPYNRIYNTANYFLFANQDSIIRNMIPSTNPNYVTTKLDSIEYIVIHDTGSSAASSTAQANSNWATNPTNTGSSWHYTVGNDGTFQQVEDDTIAWHAGDGTGWGTLLYQDTGVAINGVNPVVTINAQGYYVIGGVASNIQAPLINDVIPTTSQIHDSGIITILGDNGNYWMGQTHVIGGKIANRGGNRNGIGIEMAINDGSDVYWTWQKTAKLVADLLTKHDLTTDRVKFHEHFSGKLCPQTLITAGLVDDFYKMVEVEYMMKHLFSDYSVSIVSHNPDIMNHRGQIINPPAMNTNVSYTLTISNGSQTEEITLHAFVPGQYDWK